MLMISAPFPRLVVVTTIAVTTVGTFGCDKGDAAGQPVTTTNASATPAATAPTPGAPAPRMQGKGAAMMQAGVDACTGNKSGDACTVTDGTNARAGSCDAPPAGAPNTQLSCRPSGGGGGAHGGDHGGRGGSAPAPQ